MTGHRDGLGCREDKNQLLPFILKKKQKSIPVLFLFMKSNTSGADGSDGKGRQKIRRTGRTD